VAASAPSPSAFASSARRILIFGLAVLVVGLGLFATALQPGTAYFPELFLAYALIGVGAGASFMTLVTLALTDVPARDAGIASGLVNVSVQISAALGLAALGTIASTQASALTARGETAIQALSGGYQLAFVVAAGCVSVLPPPVADRITVAPATGLSSASRAVTVIVEALAPFEAVIGDVAAMLECPPETVLAVTTTVAVCVIATVLMVADTVLDSATSELSVPVATPLAFVGPPGCVSVFVRPVAARTTVAP